MFISSYRFWSHLTIRIALLLCAGIASSYATDWSGNINLEARLFKEAALTNEQEDSNLSLSFEPELYHRFKDSRDSISFIPFLRLDQNDDERSHFDIRELYWQKVARDWELTLGINKVFWGVTETIHLVDIINQTDSVENIDGEDKLGQTMAHLSLIRDWGVVDIFMLPEFRERTFPDAEGRPRLTPLVVDTDNPIYDSQDEEQHIDYAIRWSNSIDVWDIGLAHFTGTSREPVFIPDLTNPGRPVLRPRYDLIQQSSIDIQATLEAWLLKLEAIHRSGQRSSAGNSFIAAALGFEYTFVGVFNSNADIGLVTEYLYDERDEQPFNDDLAIGARIVLNDTQSSEILVATVNDLDNQSISFFIEASRRLGNSYTLNLEYRGASNVDNNDPITAIDQDELLQIELSYFF